MRVLFATEVPFLPDVHGGAECSIDELARSLIARGHAVEVIARPARAAELRHTLWRLATLRLRPARLDRRNGYPTWVARPWRVCEALRARIRAFRPDVVTCWNQGAGEIAREAAQAATPVIVWVPDVSFCWHRDERPLPPDVVMAGCTRFVVGRIRERLGVEAGLLRAPHHLDEYRAAAHAPEAIGLVNPRRSKGVHIALAVAALLPHRRFVFVRGQSNRKEDGDIDAQAHALPNVTIEASLPDMRPFYARLALLLVPSTCEDAGPRVILEAHVNGIPVVGSDRGGIPEVAGDAGVLLPAEAPAEAWATAVEEALEPARRADLAARAHRNAARPEHGIAAATESFLALAAEARARVA
jgi:glycosyltransferase involved in cell wall biosynthesis